MKRSFVKDLGKETANHSESQKSTEQEPDHIETEQKVTKTEIKMLFLRALSEPGEKTCCRSRSIYM